jgi:RsmE family RNA methyltransferase
MNLILLFKSDFIEDTKKVRLQGRRLKHILEVHRASVGDQLCVGLSEGYIGHGVVTGLDNKVLEMDVLLSRKPPDPLPVTLILALPRPKVLKRVLLTVSSMGVKQIVLLNSYRVEKSYWQSKVMGKESLKKHLILGLELARDTVMPEVWLRPLFKPFVEDELPALIKGSFPIVAHPSATKPFPIHVSPPVTLAIGPEGGFTPYEAAKLVSCGFSSFHIGERILNVETAVAALLSRLS